MGDVSMPMLDPRVFENNLAALREWDQKLADALAAAPQTESRQPVPANTRDGILSFRLTTVNGGHTWLGRSSIPLTRADALLERFDAGQANPLIPGVGHGTLVRRLTEQLAPHRAVFVWEENLHNLALSLQIHDLANALSSGRLVLIHCQLDDLTQTLTAWLQRHPGHLCPDRLMMWPGETPAEIARIRVAVESAYQQTEQTRAQALSEYHADMAATSRQEVSADAPTLAVLAMHARPGTWALADALANASSSLNWPAVRADIRGPADMHALARAHRLAEAKPIDLAVLVDIVQQQAEDVLPSSIPAIAWLSPTTNVTPELAERSGNGPIALFSRAQFDQAVTAGVAPERIVICPPPCLTLFDEPAPDTTDRPIDVILLADIGWTDVLSLAPKLPTYGLVWKTACDLLAARIDGFKAADSDEILRRAEQKCATRIDEPQTREHLTGCLAKRAAPSLLWRFIAQALVNNDIRIAILGPGWKGFFGEQAHPTPYNYGERSNVLRQAKLAVCADVEGAVAMDALLAAGAGAVVLARKHPADLLAGGIQTLLEPEREMVPFAGTQELVAQVRELLGSPKRCLEIGGCARKRCENDHRAVSRLRTLAAVASPVFENYPH